MSHHSGKRDKFSLSVTTGLRLRNEDEAESFESSIEHQLICSFPDAKHPLKISTNEPKNPTVAQAITQMYTSIGSRLGEANLAACKSQNTTKEKLSIGLCGGKNGLREWEKRPYNATDLVLEQICEWSGCSLAYIRGTTTQQHDDLTPDELAQYYAGLDAYQRRTVSRMVLELARLRTVDSHTDLTLGLQLQYLKILDLIEGHAESAIEVLRDIHFDQPTEEENQATKTDQRIVEKLEAASLELAHVPRLLARMTIGKVYGGLDKELEDLQSIVNKAHTLLTDMAEGQHKLDRDNVQSVIDMLNQSLANLSRWYERRFNRYTDFRDGRDCD